MADVILIIGAGPAGVVAVETLREHDRQSRVVMLSAEPFPPYSPPAMVDHFITGSNLHLWRPTEWTEQFQVDYRAGVRVTSVHPDSHQVHLADGGVLAYDHLVIAVGSRLYAPLPGVDLPGVYNFKSLSAAETLIGKVRRGEARTALIVGAGFIGMEIALLLRELGVQVIQVEMLDQVMPAMLDPFTASFALQLMRQRGVEVRLNTKARSFVSEKNRAIGVELETGEVLRADLLIAATGVRPNIDFLENSGIVCRWGISVDNYLRTSAPDVYAAGDVIETPDRLTGEVYVHAILPNAIEQGRVVGLNLGRRSLGYLTPYEGAERMNSLKHLGLPILAAGLKHGEEVLRARLNGGWRTLYLQDDRLIGFQLVGGLQAAGALRTLLNRQERLGRLKDRLLEPNFGQGVLVWSALSL